MVVDINSETDSKTQMSDGSSKTANTKSSKASNIFQKTNTLPLGPKLDEFDEVLEYEQNKSSANQAQKEKVQFYEICFTMKTKMFPKNHLARYANIASLYQEAR